MSVDRTAIFVDAGYLEKIFAGWVNLVEGNVDGGTIYCGSPSGAFVDGGRLP